MKHSSRVIGLASALLFAAVSGSASDKAAQPIRIGVVSVQDRSEQGISADGLDTVLARLLRSEGLLPVFLAFQPPADVEYAARRAECDYILYTDIVAVRQTARSQFAKALRMISGVARPRVMAYADHGPIVAEIEFRLFFLDEVLPRISTTVTAKSSKTEPGRSGSATVHRPIQSALAAALAREVQMIRTGVSSNKAAPAEF